MIMEKVTMWLHEKCISLQKHAHAVYTEFFHGHKNDLNCFTNFIFLLKTYIVGTSQNRLIEAVLTSTHNQCFRAIIRK